MTESTTKRHAVGRLLDRFVSDWPEPTEDERYIDALATEYHARTEAYDRTVCTGPILHGAIMPATHYELVRINQNALSVKREIEERAMRERGIERKVVSDAIRRHDR